MTHHARDAALEWLLRREATAIRIEHNPADAGSLAVCERHVAEVRAEIEAEARAVERDAVDACR